MMLRNKSFVTCGRLPLLFAIFYGSLFPNSAIAQARLTPKVDYIREVLPIFKAHCYQCHSGAQTQGGLSLDTRALMLKGGVSGIGLIAGSGAKSQLVERILGHDGKSRMPLGFAPISELQTSIVKKWIDEGAAIPEGASFKKHWAYVKPMRAKLPKTVGKNWVRNPIDAFILARLETEKLKPSPEADRITLLRRLTLDLTGLPPTLQEADAFLADKSVLAYEKAVDRLLASPRYGERMALPWLDTARYADSNGFQQDGDTYQYVWRDWVVKALNSNLPFDQFAIQQLAGDLLPNATDEQRIATGFNRCHLLNGEGGAIAEEQRNVILFDRVDVTTTAFLGATMACAQCHDHKYDPLTQKDYYSMMAFFNNVPESGTPPFGGQYRIAPPFIFYGKQDDLSRLKKLDADVVVSKTIVDAFPKNDTIRLKEAIEKLQKVTKERDDLSSSLAKVMVMSDAQPRKTHLLERGNYEAPKEEVQPDIPLSLGALPKEAPKNRLGLAKWLVSDENPLTARVQVNRYWQLFFGQGLVKTSENLGTQCDAPSHPELLDWLAVEFRESGWDVKRIHRLIVTSATYRQSSRLTPAILTRDPENRLLSHASRFRLSSLALRDLALATSGLMNDEIGGKPVYPYQPKGIWDGLAITKERDFTYPQSNGKDLFRRSLYTFWRRTVAPSNMFDSSVRTTCKVRLSTTSTPLHALTTLNDETWVEAARALAQKVITGDNYSPEGRLREAFRIVCSRTPTQDEIVILKRSFNRAISEFHANPKLAEAFLKAGASPRNSNIDPVEHATYASVCLAIYNLDEALTRE